MEKFKFWPHLKEQVLAGVVFLIPVFVVITIVQKLWKGLSGIGNSIADALGLKALIGSASATLSTTLLLVIIFYVVGWLVRFSLLNKFRDWLEQSVLQYIPGYLSYKAKMQEKLLPKKDARKPVWVAFPDYRRPGFLIEEKETQAVVYFPNAPDSNNGQVMVVDIQMVSHMDTDATALIKMLQANGKSLIE
ncbi:MAG: hypothetical protein MUE99_11140 [Chitinophagaceae bacterium]|jgi:uncharacterized membrane protein|nr:hypothetical protein [Chitinophagaceae bacterium]